MKTTAFATAILLSLLPACKKHDCGDRESYQSSARISSLIHPDCGCCGYSISIDDQNYTFMHLPSNAGFDLDAQSLPLDLLINWHRDSTSTCGQFARNLIVIDAVKRK